MSKRGKAKIKSRGTRGGPEIRDEIARRARTASRMSAQAAANDARHTVLGYAKAEPLHQAAKVGRNDPCPCGSGRKHKRCCGAPTNTAGEGPLPPRGQEVAATTKVSHDGGSLVSPAPGDLHHGGPMNDTTDHPKSPHVQQLEREQARVERYYKRMQDKIGKAIGKAQIEIQHLGLPSVKEEREHLAKRVAEALRFNLSGPVYGQQVMLDLDHETGELSNPRLSEPGLTPEEIMWPCDEAGEPIECPPPCDLIVGVPLLAWLPEV